MYHQSFSPPLQNNPYLKSLLTLRDQLKKDSTLWSFLELPQKERDLSLLESIAQHYQDHFSDVLILGTGGSSLGGRVFLSLKESAYRKVTPRLHFCDNLDPTTFNDCLETLDPQTTGVIVISKSGETAETLAQFLSLVKRWKSQLNIKGLRHHITLIGDSKPSSLKKLGEMWDLPWIPHPPQIGGRFSCFSVVGLLPALIAGVDVDLLLKEAQNTKQMFFETEESNPLQGASFLMSSSERDHKNNHVFFCYGDSFVALGAWIRQLVAESLGKDGKGMTPIFALGPLDQHSQLQLYLDGPPHHAFTFIMTENPSPGPLILENEIPLPTLSYFSHKTMGDLLKAEQHATSMTLQKKGYPVRLLSLPQWDEKTCGALLMHFMIETCLVGHLLDVNPFNQPAVEEGKIMTKKLLQGNVA